MATVIILAHKAQSSLTANNYNIMAKVVTTYTFINIVA
jgi:hypothetical protein